MPTKQELEADLKEAMRAGDRRRKQTLRMVLTAVKLEEVERGGELDEETMLKVIQGEAKSRHETIEDAEKAERADLAEEAQAELEILESFLPEPLTDEELTALARQAIEQTGADGMSQMGQVMGVIMPQVTGRADGKRVSEIVRGLLAES
jgi:uncharacterized protein YqeY